MEFDIKTGPQGHLYLPKRIRKSLGKNVKLLPNTNAVVLYPENAEPSTVIKSLKVIISDLELYVGAQCPKSE